MKAIAAILILALVAVVAGRAERDYQMAFTKFMRTYEKSYSHAEFRARYQIFKANMDLIDSQNARGGAVFAMNELGDLSPEEFTKIYTTNMKKNPQRFVAVLPTSGVPASINWANQGAVTPIKNQGQCGSCWSFSSTGSLEGINFITNKNLLSFSEEQLCDCSDSYGNEGCDGGLMDYAFQYTNANGIELESTYPYTAGNGTTGNCQYNAAQVKFTNKGGASGSGYTDVTQNSEDQLQAAVAQQPVSVAIEADQSCFQFYSSGVLTASNCDCGTQLDHGVLAVGYDTDPNQGPYWIVKNSWGASWGASGYVWLQRGSGSGQPGMCGIAMDPSYPTAQ
jgi:cathepsin L